MNLLWMTGVRESSEDGRIERFGNGEIFPSFIHGWYLGVSGVAELPREYREGGDRFHAVAQIGIHLETGASQLVKVMGFLEGPIVAGKKRFQRLFRRLLTMKQRIFDQRGINVQVDAGTT